MFKRILIVLDADPAGTAAVHAGATLARRCGADLVFLTGVPRPRSPLADLPDSELIAQWQALDHAQESDAGRLAKAARAAEALGVMWHSVPASVDAEADDVRRVVEAAAAARCELIAIGGEDNNAVVRLLTGSLIPGIVTASAVPVLVCPPRAEAAAAHQCVLVVLGRGEAAHAALDAALAHGLGAELLLVHILDPDVVPMVDMSTIAAEPAGRLAAETRERSQRVLAAASAIAAQAGVAARAVALPAGAGAKDVAALATDQSCAMIVIATDEHNALVRLLTGSLVPGLITAAPVPLLVCREASASTRKRVPRRRRHRRKAGADAAGVRPEPQ